MFVERNFGLCFFLIFIFLIPLILAPISKGESPQTKYNETEARQLINLAAGAYASSPQGCINVTFGSNAHLYTIFKSSNLICDIIENSCASYTLINDHEKRIYIVFRGTKGSEQLWFEALQSISPKVDFMGIGLANKYFCDALEALWPNIEPAFVDPRYKDYDITFTGHSLGGALAALAALKTVVSGHRNGSRIRGITFGEPRIGNSILATKFNQLLPNLYRVVHAEDIIPHFPRCGKINNDDPKIKHKNRPCDPTKLEESFHHGTEIWYPKGMGLNDIYHECLGSPNGEDFKCSDGIDFHFHKYKDYVNSHRYYFGHKVPPFGKSGCTKEFPLEENKSGEHLISHFIKLTFD